MRKYLLFVLVSLIFLLSISLYQYIYYYDNKLHVIFCNVGQGDAILIKTPSNRYLMVDGGPDESVLTCLSSHMPFWDRTIDLVFLTHPHLDHFLGLIDVLDRYIVLYFVSENLGNKTSSYDQFVSRIKEKRISQRSVLKGDRYKLGKDVYLVIEAPSVEALRRSSPNGVIGESSELASLILRLTYKDFDLILPGDSQTEALSEVASQNSGTIEVLQIPHHGSKTGVNKEVVELIAPGLAVISVGSKNRYGHPSREVLNLLRDEGIAILRTDKNGDVEIVSDGKKWWVK